jgi:hypothetical protein
MSKHVDWERQDLFHYRIDDAIAFAWRGLKTRNVRILHDYGLYEYSCLIFRDAIRSDLPVPNTWLLAEEL